MYNMNVDTLQKSRWEDTQLEGVVLRLIIMSPFKEPSNQIPSITSQREKTGLFVLRQSNSSKEHPTNLPVDPV